SGHTLVLTPSRYPSQADVFAFSIPAPAKGLQVEKESAKRVGVFPNPYYAGREAETTPYGRFVTFNNLPPKATIRIFNLAGHLVRSLEKDDPSQFLEWDLRNDHNWLVGSGMYVVHVEMPDVGEMKVLKLAVIQQSVVPGR
ncbi:MAG: T9SS type A sorting domain-containing protein, partial [Bacteroidota bacterium]